MLTRLRIQGFRNLLDVDLRFGPLTCLAGRNGAGKSGLFDAVRFLIDLSQGTLDEAAAGVRGAGPGADPAHLFSCFGDWRARELRLTAELIVDQRVEDDYGVVSEAATTALQYLIGLKLERERGRERLVLVEEHLTPLGVKPARRGLGFPARPAFREVITGRRAAPFLSTEDGVVRVHHEGHGGRRFPAKRARRTALSGMADSEFPALLAARRELERWQITAAEPSALRRPSGVQDPEQLGPRGENLAAALAGIDRNGGLETLAERLRGLGEDVLALRVIEDPIRRQRSVEARGQDGVFRPTWALSEATLRSLALGATLLQGRGLVGLEVPESGLHPERIPALVALLRSSAVDTERAVGPDNPLRQVLISTHSPRLVRELTPGEIVFVDPMEVERGGVVSRVGVLRAPAGSWREVQREEEPEAPLITLAPTDRKGQIILPFQDPSDP